MFLEWVVGVGAVLCQLERATVEVVDAHDFVDLSYGESLHDRASVGDVQVAHEGVTPDLSGAVDERPIADQHREVVSRCEPGIDSAGDSAAAMATTVHWMRDMVAGLCIGMAIAIAAAAMPFGPPHCPCSLVAARGK